MVRPTRPGLGAAASLVLLVLVVTAGWLAYTGLQAKGHLDDARLALTGAREALLDRDIPTARAAITAAATDTRAAREATDGPVWRLATNLPGEADNSLRVVRGLAAAADELAGSVLPQALTAAEAIDPEALRRPDGSFDLDVIRAATPPVASSARTAEQVRDDIRALPTELTPGPVERAYEQVAEQVDTLAGTLSGASTALEIAPALLGEDRPRRFFVLVQQNAESRGTGGLPGGYAVLETDKGRLRVVAAGSRQDLDGQGPIAVPPDVPVEWATRYGGYGAFDLPVNINVSPDLPVVSRLIAQRWRDRTGQEIDGVIALDAQALAAVLEGSGAIQVGGRSIAPENLVEYLAIGQYADFAPPPGSSALDLTLQRKDALSDAATATLTRLVAGGGDTQALLTGVGDAVRSGHLRLASDDPALQPALSRSGADGGLPDGDRPLAYPVVFNSTGGKLDTFLDRSISYQAGSCRGDRRRSTITVTLTNRAPAEGLPPYLRIRADGDDVRLSTDNAVALSVYTTPGSTLTSATLDGVALDPANTDQPVLTSFDEAGLPGYEIFVELPREQPRTLVLSLEEPVVAGEAVVPEQPLARPLQRDVDVPAC
ncbi:MAG TPA: DUF4012 domain-containing protein [Mycobacteriales bacterium]|nr:DUF4012 domain-containing protein [Mycobacteriales bacterium]